MSVDARGIQFLDYKWIFQFSDGHAFYKLKNGKLKCSRLME
jgi:hypothetical protein